MGFKYIVFISLLLCRNISTAEGIEDREVLYRMSDRVFMCSKWLSSIIDNFCNNVYKIVKRDTSLMLDKLTPKDLHKNGDKRRDFAENRWRRIRRQVASECCERPCTVETILMYCPDDAKVLVENPNIFQ